MPADDLLLVGYIARAHGNRGQVIVRPETDFPDDRFRPGQVLLAGTPERHEPRTIVDVRFHRGRPILTLEGVTTMDDAEALAGTELWLSRAALAPLPAGTFYRHDLAGCEVVDEAGTPLGTVTKVDGTLDRSYLEVAREGLANVTVPMVDEICRSIDLATRRIVVRLPDGLMELNATRAGGGAGRGRRK